MSDRRKGFRQHIRAAHAWLGQVEKSLEKKNDIRGDLNFMLAQAELQRAKETKTLTRQQRWLKRLLPMGAAALMAAGCFLVLQVMQPKPVQEATHTAVQQLVMPEPVMTRTAQTGTEAAAPMQPAQAVHPAATGKDEPPVSPQQRQEMSAAQPRTAERTVLQENKPARATGVPSADMQKLMQSAGKTLRAQ